MMSREDQARPNFLIFVTDEHPGAMLGCDGHPVMQTPHIDRIAQEGVRFSRCYTVHPMCMATRATWFTGRTPRGHGVRCNGIALDASIPTITEALRQAGYATHGTGKHHLRNWGHLRDTDPKTLDPVEWCESRSMWMGGRIAAIPTPYYGLEAVDFLGGNGNGIYGNYVPWVEQRDPDFRRTMAPPPHGKEGASGRRVWENQLPAELHYTEWMTERGIEFLRRVSAEGKPFFLWHSFPDPHPPYTAPAPWGGMYDPADVPPPNRRDGELDDLPPHFRFQFENTFLTSGCGGRTNIPEEHVRRMTAMVYGMISQVDHHVGRILDELDRLSLSENTVVAFLSDHGRFLGDHWMDNMPPAHFEEVLRVPGVWRFPRRFKAGLATDALVSHLDFAPTILDLAGLPIPEGPAPPTPECKRQRTPWPGHSLVPLLTGEADSVQDSVVVELDEDYLGLQLRTLITKDHWLTVYGGGREFGELFDLKEDPRQLHNRWNDPGRQALKRELQAELLYRLIETESALPRRLCHA
ncbi:MAG: sulfatase-like hydrolase/transferase [Planctomycetota bacterium]